jgi:putative transposase
VRAGLVARADQYAWSSYRANARGYASAVVAPHEQYLRLGRTPGERQAAYRDLFGLIHGDQLEEIRSAINTGYVLGTASFKALMARRLGVRVEMGTPGRRTRKAAATGQLDLLKPE